MAETGLPVVLVGVAALGLLHGVEPGHGWPIAAAYALDRSNEWASGFVASFLLGLGHLVSSLAVVGLFFLAGSYLDLSRLTRPLSVFGYPIGGPLGVVAGVLLILLGIREYRHGQAHGGGDDGEGLDTSYGGGCEHGDRHEHGVGQEHDGGHEHGGGRERGRHRGHDHDHFDVDDVDALGLTGIVWTAFILGFVHEEEFQIVGLCLGVGSCLPLMVVYALSVLVGIVGLTMLLIAGYYRFEERIEGLADHLPTISATILVVMGTGFVLGVL